VEGSIFNTSSTIFLGMWVRRSARAGVENGREGMILLGFLFSTTRGVRYKCLDSGFREELREPMMRGPGK
jgi:hypothetical protein